MNSLESEEERWTRGEGGGGGGVRKFLSILLTALSMHDYVCFQEAAVFG